ncbi:hypothetical protein R3W88_008649 [Solanum pinnatisectum]|uniref:TF-B3 domain-containing protein n=1 Tax=Solanum pinnatisectum TaxID=50273 RepID=A0AAV9M9I2_9SOLN|nr:hypothetical protein R3W88_008649 [Solanum pinnatisectum]
MAEVRRESEEREKEGKRGLERELANSALVQEVNHVILYLQYHEKARSRVYAVIFARLISHLKDQETELEDSTGQRWKVGISNHNGSLAIRQGWQTFSSEHGLKMGDFLNSTPSVTAVPVSDRAGQLPVTTTFASNIDADTLKSAENGFKGKKTRVVKRELKQMAAKTRCPSKKLNGKEPKIIEKDGQGCPEAEIGNNKAIESEPADSGDTSFPDAGNFSCLLRVDGRSFLELPQSWPEVLPSSKKMRRITIYLKGPDNRTRPVIYHEDFGSKVLTGNWASFTEVYGLKTGDECLFQLLDLSERMFTVKFIHKADTFF